MNIFLVSKVSGSGSELLSRYIYAKDSQEAEEIYRKQMQVNSDYTLSISTINSSGMLLANRDTPSRLRNRVKIHTYE